MGSLPEPRQLLTSLIDSITRIPLSPPPPIQQPLQNADGTPADAFDGGRSRWANGNPNYHPLKAVPQSQRQLITTLHVLFPTMLLPALDLLDRGLLLKLIRASGERINSPALSSNPALLSVNQQPSGSGLGAEDGRNDVGCRSNGVYIVHSAQSGGPDAASLSYSHRRHQLQNQPETAPSRTHVSGRRYLVRLRAWHCTCAAFAFAAFLPDSRLADQAHCEEDDAKVDSGCRFREDDADGETQGKDRRRCVRDWSFGGLSFSGIQGSDAGVACCKHLLACLLAERWHAALGGYVIEKEVGKEEMAGLVADI
ncbi:hypothetical protein VTK73DRAFT_9090 [Phialemonium thermophilum]|uniref:SWIM-type domain-containing protein n=1 Tax=Phialemonium thermophilum TaxID=223376 RepID=A0ABR3XM80_9PEZI